MPSTDLMVHVAYSHIQGQSFRKIKTIFDIPKSTAQRWYKFCSEFFEITQDTNKIIDMVTEKKEKVIADKILESTNINVLKFIKRSLDIQPFQTFHLLQQKIEKKFNIHILPKVIGKYIK